METVIDTVSDLISAGDEMENVINTLNMLLETAKRAMPAEPRLCENMYQVKRIAVTKSIAVNVITVPAREYVKNDGNLYYVTPYDHFAVMIGGVFFHSGMGVISHEVTKTVECNMGANCQRATQKYNKCTYYHNPFKTGIRDTRNFTMVNYRYMPRDSPINRRIGSIDQLTEDLMKISLPEAERFIEQTAQDIIISIILYQNKIAK